MMNEERIMPIIHSEIPIPTTGAAMAISNKINISFTYSSPRPNMESTCGVSLLNPTISNIPESLGSAIEQFVAVVAKRYGLL